MDLTVKEALEIEAAPRPDVSHIITEDDTPVDNLFSEKQQRLLVESLYSSWRGPQGDGQPFVAMCNVGLFFMPNNNPVVPDTLVSLDVQLPEELWEKHHRSYFVWEYGKPPEVVIEIVSNRKGNEDSSKLHDYTRAGVAYYVIFDPANHLGEQTLRVFEKQGINFVERPDHWMPGLELGFQLWEGEYEGHRDVWLRWSDLNDNLVATAAESKKQAEERADEESKRAEQERERAERLAEKLRSLGVNPDEID